MAPRSTRQRLGEAIRERRDLLGLTQEEAAERSSLSPRNWRSLEAGRPAIALEIAEQVIAGLGWSWLDLAEVLSPPTERGTPARVHRLVDEAWKRATPRERDLMLAPLRVLVGKRPR